MKRRYRKQPHRVVGEPKECTKCRVVKPLSEFGKGQSTNALGLLPRCKKCTTAYQLSMCHRYKRPFLLTPEEYDARLAAQGGVCASCHQPETVLGRKSGLPQKLAVDHCHTTGEVRGLLCRRCNLTLGVSREDFVALRLLGDYKEQSLQRLDGSRQLA